MLLIHVPWLHAYLPAPRWHLDPGSDLLEACIICQCTSRHCQLVRPPPGADLTQHGFPLVCCGYDIAARMAICHSQVSSWKPVWVEYGWAGWTAG